MMHKTRTRRPRRYVSRSQYRRNCEAVCWGALLAVIGLAIAAVAVIAASDIPTHSDPLGLAHGVALLFLIGAGLLSYGSFGVAAGLIANAGSR